MFEWISNNAVTVIAIAVILIVVGFAVFSLMRDRKRGSGGCTGNCATCGMGCSYGKSKK